MLRKRLVAASALLLIVLLMFIQSGPLLHARTLTLAQVSADIMDLTASTNLRRDLNGEPCALLKISFNKPGLAFEGNVIGDVSYNAGEYLVYVKANTRYVKVKHQDFDPLMIDFEQTSISPLEGKKVYVVKLQSAGSEEEHVTFIVRPAEAELMIDFKKYPTVDGRAELTLTPGEHSYSVASSGYEMQGSRFMVYADSPNRHVIELDRRTDTPPAVPTNNNITSTSSTPAQSSSVIPSNTINGHEYVDLGLPSGLKWATCNVGAKSPSDYGDYFAWGEISPKKEYTAENHKISFSRKDFDDISGNPNYDAATANWGSTWRMPTKNELKELKEKCQWFWQKLNGIDGCRVIGPNGKSIFLPAAGNVYHFSFRSVGLDGDYWCSTGEYRGFTGSELYFNSSQVEIGSINRYYGLTVRPVSN